MLAVGMGHWWSRNFDETKSGFDIGLGSNLVSMSLLALSRLVMSSESVADGMLLLATAALG